MTIPIERQVSCVERELRFRERVYARRVTQGKMTAEQASDELDAMRAVLATVRNVADRQRLL